MNLHWKLSHAEINIVQDYSTDVHTTCGLNHGVTADQLNGCVMNVHAVRATVMVHSEDVIAEKIGKCGEYVVLRNCPAKSAARLRVLEKHFVLDHALLLAQRFGCGSCCIAWISSSLAKHWGRTTSRNVWEHQYKLHNTNFKCVLFPALNNPFSGWKCGW